MSPRAENPQSLCPFCSIARGEPGSTQILCQEDSWVAFFPDAPATPGHTLIIPRAHIQDLWHADRATACALAGAEIRVGNALQRALAPEGMNLITSAGAAAEQTVFHLHVHLVPRWSRDELDIWPPKKPMRKDLKIDLAASIRRELFVDRGRADS